MQPCVSLDADTNNYQSESFVDHGTAPDLSGGDTAHTIMEALADQQDELKPGFLSF